MIKLIINRIIQSIPVIIGAITISFFIIHIAPGDPIVAILGEQYNPSEAESLIKSLKLDEPIIYQYIKYISWLKKTGLV